MTLKFVVTGMTCAACSARVEKVTKEVAGVEKAEVNLLRGTMTVQAQSPEVAQDIIRAVQEAGYQARLDSDTPNQNTQNTENPIKEMKKRLIGSGILLAILMYFTMGHMVGLPAPHWYHGVENSVVAALLQLFLTLPVLYLNRVYYSRGFRALLHRSPNMDSLIAVGSAASLLYGIAALFCMAFAMGHGKWDTVQFYGKNLYFESAAMILTLITLGKFLETRAKGKTGDAIRALMDLRPETAVVLREGQECTVPAEQVQVGDLVVVRSGGRIPVDGIVVEGRGAVDQSALTGESVPVEKEPGDPVSAATMNMEGYLVFRAEKVGEDTTLQQIIRMVEEAGGSKAPIARLADRIAGIFVPTVMAIAAVTLLGWMLAGRGAEFALNAAVSVLVISCPCALGLATPVAIMVGTGRGAGMGVLFKNGAALEHLHGVDTVVVDKTGTLTLGKPGITDVIPTGISEEELLSLAAALEAKSEHPFAKAILERAGVSDRMAEDFVTLPGRGVSGTVDGISYLGGNRRLMEENSIIVPDVDWLEEQGKTPLYFATADGTYLGLIVAADMLKPDSSEAVEAMEKQHLQVIMLTGDNEKTAWAIARQAGIQRVISDVLPGDKAGIIQQLQREGRRVVMVGDGINDAPALAAADTGMAIGAGTDVAMESADVVLVTNSLFGVVNGIRMSKATVRNIKQNLFWAFFYNCLGIPIAAFGMLSPMIGALAMSMSSVFVVTNALRLRSVKQIKQVIAIQQEEIVKEEPKMETVIRVEGMMCTHCKAMVEKVCKAVPGTTDAVVDLQAKNVTVTGTAAVEALKKAITDAGYEVVE